MGTIPEKGSQEGLPEEVIAYFGEDVSTTFAWFTLVGPKGEVQGELAYYSESPCEPEGPSCFHWHFAPYDPLTTGQYTAEVFGVTDRAGLEMEAPYAWSFEVTEESGGELLAPPAVGPQAEEGGEPAPAAEPAAVPETVEPAAEEEPLEAPAGEGGEIEGGTPGVLYVRTTKYYYFGAQRVAMRQTGSWGENVVYYLVTDHLGTTSLVLCGNVSGCDGVPNGGRVAESRHYPYGAVRWTWTADGSGTLPTDYRFTGQRDVGLGLTHMGARFLDTSLGRWTSADTLVPSPSNPQSLNRYSWVLNRPLGFRDPTGHKEEGECGFWGEACWDDPVPDNPPVPPSDPAPPPDFLPPFSDSMAGPERALVESCDPMDCADAMFNPYTPGGWDFSVGDEWYVATSRVYVVGPVTLSEAKQAAREGRPNPVSEEQMSEGLQVRPNQDFAAEAYLSMYIALWYPYVFVFKGLEWQAHEITVSNFEPRYLEMLLSSHPQMVDTAYTRVLSEYHQDPEAFMRKMNAWSYGSKR